MYIYIFYDTACVETTTTLSIEAPARHKGGIASRRNYSCDTTQLFWLWPISIFYGAITLVATQFELCRVSKWRRTSLRFLSCPKYLHCVKNVFVLL